MRITPSRVFYIAVLASVALIRAAFAGSAPQTEIIKREADVRAYQEFVLANGLKALVISDPKADRAAAALDVYVGSGSDPAKRAGLAHFLEHMLFLGTRKYPDPGAYQQYINTHGGNNNAYTAFDHTNYFFDIDPQYLAPALDRFAQFFITPLFNADFVRRERNAVNAEYESKRNNDWLRIRDAQRMVFNPAHPLSRFEVGNLTTLADRDHDPVRDDLMRFYQTHYSANIMALVVIGRKPPAALRRLVEKTFSAVPNRNAMSQRVAAPLFAPDRLPVQLEVQPEKEIRRLALTFPITPPDAYYRSKPLAYIGNLLGHEGQGSLLAALRARNWADGLSAGLELSYANTATFNVTVSLTIEGLRHQDEIIAAVLHTIDLIRRQGIKQSYYDEQARMAQLDFRFHKRTDAIVYAQQLASNLQIYPAQDVLIAPYRMDRFDPRLIRRYLDEISLAHMQVTVVGKSVPSDATTHWYQTPYRIDTVAPARLARWAGTKPWTDVHLPVPNPFIPDDVALHPEPDATAVPVRIQSSNGFALWFRNDTEFGAPRASVYLSIRSPRANDSARDAVLTDLYVDSVNEQLNAFSYPARLAGLDYNLYRHVRGVSVRIDGYDDKELLLLDKILGALTHPLIDPGKFATHLQQELQSLRNDGKDTPYHQDYNAISRLMMDPSWSIDQRIKAASTLGPDDLRAFTKAFRKRLDVVALVHGNVRRVGAVEIGRRIDKALLGATAAVSVPAARVVRLPAGKVYRMALPIDHNDASIAVYLQGDSKAVGERALTYLLGQVIGNEFYRQLRTEDQLGYVVSATALTMLQVPALSLVVQSPNTGPKRLYKRINRFLGDFRARLAAMPEAEFEINRQSLVADISRKDQTLQDRSNYYWTEIDHRASDFDTRERLASTVAAIGKQQLLNFYNDLIGPKSGRLVVYSDGRQGSADPPDGTALDGAIPIKAESGFHRDQAFFPRN